jgi:hypothetical protein
MTTSVSDRRMSPLADAETMSALTAMLAPRIVRSLDASFATIAAASMLTLAVGVSTPVVAS